MDNQPSQQSQTKVEIPQEMQLFLKNLLRDADIHPVNDEMENAMVQELFPQLDRFIMIQITDNMPEDKVEGFLDLIEAKKPREDIERYLLDNMPNTKEVMTKAFLDFRSLYIENAQKVKSSNK